ncbi:fatty acyl-AMP ligase [Kitasatospora nipponensis]|uniref:fatty acyl-AMP ligase n=1 Tax=Kitasatospora nipponensis TaxID=258049 RepID=UPI0031DDDD28
MARAADFTDLLLQRGEELVDREAFRFVRERDVEPGTPRPVGGAPLDSAPVSYGELDRAAKRIASWLQQGDPVGQRVVVCHGGNAGFLPAFLGCLYAGAIPVPAPAPSVGRQAADRLAGILRDSAARFVLTDSAHGPAVSQLIAAIGRPEVLCLATDRPGVGDPDAWRRPASRPGEPAFLQYTSGSVGEPKGVVVTHANLLANQRAIQLALGTGAHTRLGGWLPFHHDMGLVGQLLHPLFLGSSAALLPALSFAKLPVRWLQMIGQFGVSVSGAPDFAFDLCARRVTDEQLSTLDLSGWEVAVSGAETVRAATLEAFAHRFAPAGLRPQALRAGYGMAEATLLVASGPAGLGTARRTVQPAAPTAQPAAPAGEQVAPVGVTVAPARPGEAARTVVPAGRLVAGTEALIVDPQSLRPLPDGEVGEIWLRGAGVAQGYWNRVAESAEAFHALPAPAGGEARPDREPGAARSGGYLRTGDLGCLTEDGLVVAGRIKELLIVAGRNLYPQDIEQQVQRLSVLFGAAAAFSVEADRDQVVVVQEVRTTGRDAEAELPALATAVQRCVAEEFDVAAENVLLVRPGTVRRTTSGKLRRTALRQLFLDGGIQPLHAVVTTEMRQLVASAAGAPAPLD